MIFRIAHTEATDVTGMIGKKGEVVIVPVLAVNANVKNVIFKKL